MADPLRGFNTRVTPQTQPDPTRSDQVKNSAGGYVFAVDDWTRLRRFLILGTEGGTHYISENALTKDNAKALMRCIAADGPRVVREVALISEQGLAPKQNATIFAFAACAGADPITRRAALSAFNTVIRTGYHLFLFAGYIEQFRGWGRGLRNAVGDWYLAKDARDLAFQVVKYQQREGWSHRDLLRLSHPQTDDPTKNSVLRWAVGKTVDATTLPSVILGHEMSKIQGASIPGLIRVHNLPWEALPSEALRDPAVWEALLPTLGLTALVRNLNRMSSIGLLRPMSDAARFIVDKLHSEQDISRSRIHPMQILLAQATYAQGRGVLGSMTWAPVPAVIDALNDAFHLAFGNVEPTGKRTLLCLDVSGSMSAAVNGSFLSCRKAAVAMSMVTLAREAEALAVGFSRELFHLGLSPKQRIDDAMRMVESVTQGTATSAQLPIEWAMREKIKVDTFVFYTDSETWSGGQHVHQALKAYREASGINAKMAVVAMAANNYSIADPTDPGQIDFVGLDASTPGLVSMFSKGDL